MSFTDEVQFLKIAPKIKCWRNDSEQYFLHVVGRPFDRERGQNLPFSESIDPSVNWKLFGPWSAIRQSSDDVSKDKERLIGVIREGANERDIFLELASIYAELVDRRTVDWDHVLEKTPGNEYHFVRLRQLFPKVKFVHFVRDPFDNLRSRIVRSGVIASKKVNWLGAVNMAYEWKRSLIAGAYNYSLAPDHYRMVRYEDLVRKPEQVLRKLCDFLEIEFDPIVLKQTLKAGTDLHAKKGHENIDRSPGEIDQKALSFDASEILGKALMGGIAAVLGDSYNLLNYHRYDSFFSSRGKKLLRKYELESPKQWAFRIPLSVLYSDSRVKLRWNPEMLIS
tara:strand:- start:1420 stop:2430 length:1011 start_codon:yes stop_codon:yes gene_type:complete